MPSTFIAIAATLSLVVSTLVAEETQHYPEDQWISWLHIDYPARFKLDPKSHQSEAKWWAKLDDPDSKLSVEINSYGFINNLDLLLTIPGLTRENYVEKLSADKRSMEEQISTDAKYKNVADYFKARILPKGSNASVHPGYERFIHQSKDSIVVYYLDGEASKKIYGICFQTLSFKFPEDSYSEHEKTITSIIESASPQYDTTRNPQ